MSDEKREVTDYLRFDIDAGPDFKASPRLAAALDELVNAINESVAADVEGFGMPVDFPLLDVDFIRTGKPRHLEFDSRGSAHG